jgi:hypothetical protein
MLQRFWLDPSGEAPQDLLLGVDDLAELQADGVTSCTLAGPAWGEDLAELLQ